MVKHSSRRSNRKKMSRRNPLENRFNCRICLEHIPNSADRFRPCLCQDPVHRECLEAWIKTSNHNKACDICKCHYHYVVQTTFVGCTKEKLTNGSMVALFSLLYLLLPIFWRLDLFFSFTVDNQPLMAIDDETEEKWRRGYFGIHVTFMVIWIIMVCVMPCIVNGIRNCYKGKTKQMIVITGGTVLLIVLHHMFGVLFLEILFGKELIPKQPEIRGASFLTFMLGVPFMLGIALMIGIIWVIVKCILGVPGCIRKNFFEAYDEILPITNELDDQQPELQ